MTFASGERLTAAALNAAINAAAAAASATLAIETVETDYATELGGATLATDARKVIQYAWNLAAASGTRCTLGPGTYDISSSQASDAEWPNGPNVSTGRRNALVIPAGLDFEASPAAYFTSTLTGSGSRGAVTTDRFDWTGYTRPSGARIKGGVWGKVGGASTTYTGSIFGMEIDNLTLEDVVIDGWLQGRAIDLVGNGIRVFRPTLRNPASGLNCGGIRLWGGDDFWCDGARGTCGDDALQCVVTSSTTGFWNGHNITRARYTNCTMTSTDAKGIVCGLPYEGGGAPTAAEITTSIRDVRYINCHLTSGSGGYMAAVKNENSSGVVKDVLVLGCTFDMSASTDTAGVEILGAWGGIEDVTFQDCRLLSPYRDVIEARGRVRRLTLRNVMAEAPQTEDASFRPMRFNGTDGLVIEGGYGHLMATAPGSPATAVIDLGGYGTSDTYSGDSYDPRCYSVRIGKGWQGRNIRNNHFAMRLVRATGVTVDGAVVKKASGATLSGAITISNTYLANAIVQNCDFFEAENTDPINDTNFLLTYGENNRGLRGPRQRIAGTAGSNEIVTPGAKYVYLETSSTTYAMVLNAPSIADQGNVLTIEMTVRTGAFNVTLPLTNVSNLAGAFTTATFDAVGDTLILVARGSVWWLLGNNAVTLS